MIAGLRVDDQQHGLRDVAALLRSMSLCGAGNKQEHEMNLQINSRYMCRLSCLLRKEKCWFFVFQDA
jgi:hypothetical protein